MSISLIVTVLIFVGAIVLSGMLAPALYREIEKFVCEYAYGRALHRRLEQLTEGGE